MRTINGPGSRRRWWARGTAVFGGLVLLLAACGDDGGSELSADDFVEQFTTACLAVDAELEDLPDPESYDDLVELGADAQSITAQGLETLRAIEPPADLADDVAAGLDALERTVDGSADLVTAAEAADDQAITEAGNEIDAAQEDAAAALTPLGIDCGFEQPDSSGQDEGAADAEEPPADETPADETSAPASAADIDISALEEQYEQVTPSEDLPPAEPAAAIADFGANESLDEFALQCEAGLMVACEALVQEEGVPESYARYGDTCGERVPPSGPDNLCQQLRYTPGEG